MASPIRPPERLRSLVSWQAGKVATIGTRLTAGQMAPSGRTDFALLASLEEYGPLSQAELGRRLGLDRNDVSVCVARLRHSQAVHREPDPADPRRNRVTITEAGVQYLDELQQHADVVQQDLLDGLNASERRQLIALLDRILAHHPAQPA